MPFTVPLENVQVLTLADGLEPCTGEYAAGPGLCGANERRLLAERSLPYLIGLGAGVTGRIKE
jgi:hypothetical protein